MSIILTPDKPLPGSIGVDTTEVGGHAGDTIVIAQLTITTEITGNITVEKGGSLIVQGVLKGDVINKGTVELQVGGKIDGNMKSSGKYQLDGEHIGETMSLLAGSYTLITGTGMIDIFSEKGAQMSVEDSAKITRSYTNDGRTMSNSGAITISGQSVEDSLTTSGSVVVTGSAIFK